MKPKGDKSGSTGDANDSFTVAGHAILGHPLDRETRCIHYHSAVDIIAIKFKCCNQYYPCFTCHEETAGHGAQIWSKEERDERAVLCGMCGHEMTINEYFSSQDKCPHCQSAFNPNCNKHYHLYFERET